MGLLAGYFGGRIDMVMTFLVTTRLSMPVILVALAVLIFAINLAGDGLRDVISPEGRS